MSLGLEEYDEVLSLDNITIRPELPVGLTAYVLR
jgi:hypothetical protein